MKNRSFLLPFLILLFAISLSRETRATVTTLQANIRDTPYDTGAVLGTVGRGARLALATTEHRNGWYLVTYGKQKGWIHGNTIEIGGSVFLNVPSGRRPDRWVFYGTSEDGDGELRHYFNAGTTRRSGSVIRVWEKGVDSENLVRAVMQYEINCQNSRYRTLAGVLYYSNGNVRTTVRRPEAYFHTLVPETLAEGLFDVVCR